MIQKKKLLHIIKFKKFLILLTVKSKPHVLVTYVINNNDNVLVEYCKQKYQVDILRINTGFFIEQLNLC